MYCTVLFAQLYQVGCTAMYSVHSYTRYNLMHCSLYTAVPGTISCTGLCSQLYQVGCTALYSVHSYTRYNVLHCALYTVVPGTMYCKFLCKQLYQVQCTALYPVHADALAGTSTGQRSPEAIRGGGPGAVHYTVQGAVQTTVLYCGRSLGQRPWQPEIAGGIPDICCGLATGDWRLAAVTVMAWTMVWTSPLDRIFPTTIHSFTSEWMQTLYIPRLSRDSQFPLTLCQLPDFQGHPWHPCKDVSLD